MNAEHDDFDFKPEKAHIDILRYLTQLWMDDPENCSTRPDQIADGVGVPLEAVFGMMADLLREDMIRYCGLYGITKQLDDYEIGHNGIRYLAQWKAGNVPVIRHG